jgi:CspA family cold shock protein
VPRQLANKLLGFFPAMLSADEGTAQTFAQTRSRRARGNPGNRYSLPNRGISLLELEMPEKGTIKRLVSDRGFGFITQADGTEIFFHRSKVTGSFDSLSEGQSVSYEKAMDPKRNKENAEQVTPA